MLRAQLRSLRITFNLISSDMLANFLKRWWGAKKCLDKLIWELVSAAPNLRKVTELLSFPDGSQIGVVGLDELFDDTHRDGKTPNLSVAIELVRRLSKRNYIPSNLLEEYCEVVLREYRKYCAVREGAKKQGK